MPFVLDNSVVCGWLLDSHTYAYAEVIADRLQADRTIAPPLLHLEYSNVLRTACKRGHLIAQQAQEAIQQLQEIPIDTDRQTPDLALLFSLAPRHDLSACDATYLELVL